MMEAVAGSPYAFSVYGPQIKAELNYTQDSLEDVGAIGNVGLYLSFFVGIAYDAFGPLFCIVVGAILSCSGYMLMWAGVTQKIGHTPSALSAYSFIWSNGSTWLDITAVITTVRNFPNDMGTVTGLCKSFFGLSASILTLIYSSGFKPDVNSFLLFLAMAIPAAGLAGGVVCRLVSPAAANLPLKPIDDLKIKVGYASVILLAAFLAAISAMQSQGYIPTIQLLPLALVPFIAVQLSYGFAWPGACTRTSSAKGGNAAPLLLANDAETSAIIAPYLHADADEAAVIVGGGGGGRASIGVRSSTARRRSHHVKALVEAAAVQRVTGATFIEGVLSLDLLLMIFMLFAGGGSGLVVINNLGNLNQSLGGEDDNQDVYVVLLSVCNCCGRLLFGFLSDRFAARLSRPGWLTVCVAGMTCSMLIIAFANLTVLYPAVILVGLFYGGFYSVSPSLGSERYGNRAFASIFSLTSLGPALASYLFSVQLAGSLYQSNIVGGGTVCLGSACYRNTFLILCGISALGTIVGMYLTWRMRPLYVGKGGVAIQYEAFIASYGVNSLTRSVQAACAPRCCPCGRRMLRVEEDDPTHPSLHVADDELTGLMTEDTSNESGLGNGGGSHDSLPASVAPASVITGHAHESLAKRTREVMLAGVSRSTAPTGTGTTSIATGTAPSTTQAILIPPVPTNSSGSGSLLGTTHGSINGEAARSKMPLSPSRGTSWVHKLSKVDAPGSVAGSVGSVASGPLSESQFSGDDRFYA